MVNFTYTVLSAPEGHDAEVGKTFTLFDLAQFLEINARELALNSLLSIQLASDAYVFAIRQEQIEF